MQDITNPDYEEEMSLESFLDFSVRVKQISEIIIYLDFTRGLQFLWRQGGVRVIRKTSNFFAPPRLAVLAYPAFYTTI